MARCLKPPWSSLSRTDSSTSTMKFISRGINPGLLRVDAESAEQFRIPLRKRRRASELGVLDPSAEFFDKPFVPFDLANVGGGRGRLAHWRSLSSVTANGVPLTSGLAASALCGSAPARCPHRIPLSVPWVRTIQERSICTSGGAASLQVTNSCQPTDTFGRKHVVQVARRRLIGSLGKHGRRAPLTAAMWRGRGRAGSPADARRLRP